MLTSKEVRSLNMMNKVGKRLRLGDMLRYFDESGGIYGPLGGKGKAWFVDSTYGANTNRGMTWDTAFATLDYAIGKCVASRGDVIYVAPGHAEDLPAAATSYIDIDVAGVTVVGMGYGDLRPRFDFDAATSAFIVGADNCRLVNLTFRPSAATVAKGITVEAGVTGTTIDSCEFLAGEKGDGTDEFVDAIALAAGCDDTQIINCKARLHADCDGAASVVKMTGAQDNVLIKGCDFDGPYGTACIWNITAAVTGIRIEDNLLVPTSGQPAVELVVASTGVARHNEIVTDMAAKENAIAVTGGAGPAATLAYFENYYCEQAPETGALIGTESIDDA